MADANANIDAKTGDAEGRIAAELAAASVDAAGGVSAEGEHAAASVGGAPGVPAAGEAGSAAASADGGGEVGGAFSVAASASPAASAPATFAEKAAPEVRERFRQCEGATTEFPRAVFTE